MFNKKLKKILYTMAIATLAFVLVSCNKVDDGDKNKPQIEQGEDDNNNDNDDSDKYESKQIIIKDENTVCAGVSPNNIDMNIESVESIDIRNEYEDNTYKALIRIPLPAAITGEQLETAFLRIRMKEGENPSLKADAINIPWDRLGVTWSQIDKNIVKEAEYKQSEKHDDNWYTIDVSNIVRKWLDGDGGNFGFLLEELNPNTKSLFYSSYEGYENCPELVINYKEYLDENKKVSAFKYEKQIDGNCLSFALRDKDAILAEDLGIDPSIFTEQYKEGGVNKSLEYVKGLVEQYIEKHKESLSIESVKQVSYGTKIDPEKEYMIALRVGVDERVDGSLSYDYHLQVQTEDGSWAEKFGPLESRIVPGSNKNLDPGLYPWDQNELWGTDKWNAFYSSDTIYYVIEKSDANFTTHKVVN